MTSPDVPMSAATVGILGKKAAEAMAESAGVLIRRAMLSDFQAERTDERGRPRRIQGPRTGPSVGLMVL